MVESKEYHKIKKIAHLVSIACVLQISESLIPHPIPGLRLGLSNIPTLIALTTLGFKYALGISILRTILSSLVMGTFMSPAFILSFSAAFLSTLIMGFFWWLSSFSNRYRLSIVGISIIGAFTNNVVQLYLAFFLLIRHKAIFVFLPWLCIGAIITGWITGVTTVHICRKLKEIQKEEPSRSAQTDYSGQVLSHYLSDNSLLHRIPAEAKISSILILSLAVLFFNNFWLYAGLFSFLGMITALSRISFARLFLRFKRYISLVCIVFLLPLFFNTGTHALTTFAHFKITYEGLSTGAFFASRIIFLILASSLLIMTTPFKELSQGLLKLLFPLRFLGIPEKKIATVFSLAWEAIPVSWGMAERAIRAENLKRVKNPRNLIPLLADFIVMLYVETEKNGGIKDIL